MHQQGIQLQPDERLSRFFQQREILERALEVLSADVLTPRDLRKRPQSTFLRQSMALDLLIYRHVAYHRENRPEMRTAELAGIRMVHRIYKSEFITAEERCLRLMAFTDRMWLECAQPAGGVQ